MLVVLPMVEVDRAALLLLELVADDEPVLMLLLLVEEITFEVGTLVVLPDPVLVAIDEGDDIVLVSIVEEPEVVIVDITELEGVALELWDDTGLLELTD